MREQERFQVTFFTDLHHGDAEHGDFNCKRAFWKLGRILDATAKSSFYVSLGDLVDFLHEDSTDLYEEAVAFLEKRDVCSQTDGVSGRAVYHVLGNHESAFIEKQRLDAYIPHREGVGSTYIFRRGDVLFAVLDGNFDRATGSDAPCVMRESREFVFPPAQIRWVKEELARHMSDEIQTVVWLCHVAYKDIAENSREDMARAFLSFGRPVLIFEGHTHIERFYSVAVDGKEIPVFTLAPVTFDFTVPEEKRAESFFCYTATFEGGMLRSVEKHVGEAL